MAYPSSKVPTLKARLLKFSMRIDPWLVIVLVCFILLAWANWGKLESPVIDVGREIEISARIADGQLLYRDVVTYYGPLAYYANALMLVLFGHHLEVFFTVGLLLALAATLLFYRLAKQLMNSRWATLGTVCMLLYCAIGPGSFHFVLPYSYGAVYAIVFCLLAFTFLNHYVSRGQLWWLIVAAIACGFAGLAKQEYGVAALGSVLVGVNLHSPQNFQTRVKLSVLVLAVAATCAILPLALLAQQVSWEKLYLSLFPLSKIGALDQSTLFQVSPAKTISKWLFYLKGFIVGSSVILISIAAACWIAKSKFLSGSKWIRTLVALLLSVAFARVSLSLVSWLIMLVLRKSYIPVIHPLGNLSWFLPILGGWLALILLKPAQQKDVPLLGALLVFSLLLNARWGFYINFDGLYAVSVILLFFTLLYYLTQQSKAVVWDYLLVCILVASVVNLGDLAQYRYAVNSSFGTFYTTNAALALAFNQTINAINASEASSVLVLPEGNILNFLTATHSPSRELTFLPPVLPTAKDEQAFLARLQTNPPELIAYIPRLFREWGYQTYADFNPLVDQWITQHHRLVHQFPMDEGAIRIYAPN